MVSTRGVLTSTPPVGFRSTRATRNAQISSDTSNPNSRTRAALNDAGDSKSGGTRSRKRQRVNPPDLPHDVHRDSIQSCADAVLDDMGRGTRGWGLEAPQRSRGSPSQVQQDAQGPFVQDLARHNLTEENNFGNSIVADVERLAPISSALSSYNDAGPLNSGVLFANVQLLAQSLPILDNLAKQILDVFTRSSYEEVLAIVTNPTSEPAQVYVTLTSLFTQTKKMYSSSTLFLDQRILGLTGDAQRQTIRKANLATLCMITLLSENAGSQISDEMFFDVVAGEESNVGETHADIYLIFKTQAYITAVSQGQSNGEDLLAELLPLALDRILLARKSTAKDLGGAELRLVQSANARRTELLNASSPQQRILNLNAEYPREKFLRSFQRCLGLVYSELEHNTTLNTLKTGGMANSTNQARQSKPPKVMNGVEQVSQSPHILDLQKGLSRVDSGDIIEKAARAAQFAIENYGPGSRSDPRSAALSLNSSPMGLALNFQPPGPPIQFHFEYPGLYPDVPAPPPFSQSAQWNTHNVSGTNLTVDEPNIIPFPTQSAPTRVLYERARMAASSKSSQQTPRKATGDTPTQRRPWTADEENALMAGLDQVKGPHWSQIHAMFGPGGTMNEALKDRSQVQLKDKARNLKLFFLKNKIEVPYYLQFVTGELRTRTHTRGVRNTADEKRKSNDDHRHVQDVMTLGGSDTKAESRPTHLDQPTTSNSAEISTSDAFKADAVSIDVNIDPSLGVNTPKTNDYRAGDALQASHMYPVPTANMIMQNLDRFNRTSDGNVSQRLCHEDKEYL